MRGKHKLFMQGYHLPTCFSVDEKHDEGGFVKLKLRSTTDEKTTLKVKILKENIEKRKVKSAFSLSGREMVFYIYRTQLWIEGVSGGGDSIYLGSLNPDTEIEWEINKIPEKLQILYHFKEINL